MRIMIQVFLLLAAISAGAAEKVDMTPEQTRFNGTASAKMESAEKGLRFTVFKHTPHPREVQVRIATPLASKPIGQVFELSFLARAVKPLPGKNTGRICAIIQENGRPWQTMIYWEQDVGPGEWKRYYVYGRNRRKGGDLTRRWEFKPGELDCVFNLGYGPQTVEIADIQVANLGVDVDTSELHLPQVNYAGREPDAPWRKAAAERIEKIRKGNFKLMLRDKAGKPLAGVPLEIRMVRHHFPFGTAVGGRLVAEGADADRYRREVVKLFNHAVPEASMKWYAGTGFEISEPLRRTLDFLRDNRITVRGHTVIWGGWRWLPPWIKEMQKYPVGLRQTVRDHIYYTIGSLRDEVTDFDVVNEPYDNSDLAKALGGDDSMAEWFRIARQAAPEMKLYLNDNQIISNADNLTDRHRAYTRKLLVRLRELGAPVDGMGMQGHFPLIPPAPENVLKVLDDFASLGVSIKITEYDIKTLDDQLAADYMRDILHIAFSHPAVEGFLMWGFWDGAHCLRQAPIYRQNWSLRPSGEVFIDLVHRQWKTRLSGKSDSTGTFSGRGFYGDYTVTGKYADGKPFEAKFELRPGVTDYQLAEK